jgi:hypothetical protein
MKNIKYVLIPRDLEVANSRFYIKFQYPLDKTKYFVEARQSCKKYYNDQNYYVARLDLNNVNIHKLFDIDDDETGVVSDINIYASFEECFDEEVDDFFGDDLTPKDSKTKIAATAELAILEKDSQMLTKRIQELRVKLNKIK